MGTTVQIAIMAMERATRLCRRSVVMKDIRNQKSGLMRRSLSLGSAGATVGGQQRSAPSRAVALKNGEDGRQDDQRRDSRRRQAADYGATERCGLGAGFAE